jgi:ABC-type lipoprotein export system ATPase subunit
MQFTLQQLLPQPIKEKILARPSDVWNTHFEFASGSWVKVKAPSGTGKTTLVHFLYRLRNDYDGSIQLDGRDIKHFSPDELAIVRQQKLSVVFQDMRLFGNLSAKENIELKRILPQPFCAASTIDVMAEQLGVAHVLNNRASTLSYGEQQRIAIIRALIQPFEMLIMDEPFSHLDKANTAKAAALIAAECAKRNAGFLLTDLDDDDHFAYTQQIQL